MDITILFCALRYAVASDPAALVYVIDYIRDNIDDEVMSATVLRDIVRILDEFSLSGKEYTSYRKCVHRLKIDIMFKNQEPLDKVQKEINKFIEEEGNEK